MVHEIIIHIVSPEAGQLFIEESVKGLTVTDHILGKLGRDIDLVTDPVSFNYLSESSFAPGIDICCIKIIDSGIIGCHYLLLGLIDIDGISFSGKTHAAKAEDRELISVLIFSVLHIRTSYDIQTFT